MTILGLDSALPVASELLAKRPGWIANAGHDAAKLSGIVADIPADILALPPVAVAEKTASGWVFRG
jgi:hypothetical protein